MLRSENNTIKYGNKYKIASLLYKYCKNKLKCFFYKTETIAPLCSTISRPPCHSHPTSLYPHPTTYYPTFTPPHPIPPSPHPNHTLNSSHLRTYNGIERIRQCYLHPHPPPQHLHPTQPLHYPHHHPTSTPPTPHPYTTTSHHHIAHNGLERTPHRWLAWPRALNQHQTPAGIMSSL